MLGGSTTNRALSDPLVAGALHAYGGGVYVIG